MATVRLARTLADLEPHVEQWDQLAASTDRPLMGPSWLLSWWHGHCQFNPGSDLRVALVFRDHGLVGVLPTYVHDRAARLPVYALLGRAAFWGQAPLLAVDAPPETLRLLTGTLAECSPAPAVLSLEAVDVTHDWPQRIAASWPPRGARVSTRVAADPCQTVSLDRGFDDWLRSTRLRGEHRRRLARLADRGVRLRRSTTASEYREDLASLVRLHHLRWAGNQNWLSPTVEIALERAGLQLIDSGGVRLWVLDGEQGVVGASLFAAAGGESCFLLTAYDRAWSAFGPGIATTIAGIEEAFTRGERLVDLGYGSFDYKRVMANSSRPVAWLRLFPRVRTYPLARASWAPRLARERLFQLRVDLRAGQRVNELRAGLLKRVTAALSRDRGSGS